MISSPVDWLTYLVLDWNIIYSVQLERDGLLQLLTEYGRVVSMAEVFSEYGRGVLRVCGGVFGV